MYAHSFDCPLFVSKTVVARKWLVLTLIPRGPLPGARPPIHWVPPAINELMNPVGRPRGNAAGPKVPLARGRQLYLMLGRTSAQCKVALLLLGSDLPGAREQVSVV